MKTNVKYTHTGHKLNSSEVNRNRLTLNICIQHNSHKQKYTYTSFTLMMQRVSSHTQSNLVTDY